jgi:hypothetical protein
VKILVPESGVSSQLFNTFAAKARESERMEWATQDEQLGAVTPSTRDTMAMAPAPAPAVPASPSLVAGSGEQCQTCGSYVAPDQRYCLQCGQRSGDPRLPFMDASSFMETSMQKRQPPAPPTTTPPRKSRMSPNASLIAGVGTLLLAMGIGVLIGRSGDHSSGGTASTPAVQVVTAPGAGAATGAATAATGGASTGGSAKKPKAVAQSQSSKASAANSVLKPSAKAGKLPPPTVGLGDKGSGRGFNPKTHTFDGSFFGQ